MITDLWINLPVKDISKSREFFQKLGFTFNTRYGNSPNSISLVIEDKNLIIMLFDQATFQGFINNGSMNSGTEVLLSLGMSSREAVDDIARKAVEAGGKCNKPSEIQGWMYGCLMEDLDGHKWNPIYMDMSKLPKG